MEDKNDRPTYLQVDVVLFLCSSKDERVPASPDARGPEARILIEGARMALHERPPRLTLEVAAVLPPHPREVRVTDILVTCRTPVPCEVVVQFLTKRASMTEGKHGVWGRQLTNVLCVVVVQKILTTRVPIVLE